MFTEEKKAEIEQYLKDVKGRVYIGCDSIRSRKPEKQKDGTVKQVWYATFAVVLVVHIDNSKGGKIFHYTVREKDYSQDKKPRLRLMNEVYKSVDCYLQFADIFHKQNREVEIHLDVNPKVEYASSAVVKEAVGYVKGMTELDALIKPLAYCASFGADHVVRNKPM